MKDRERERQTHRENEIERDEEWRIEGETDIKKNKRRGRDTNKHIARDKKRAN